MARPKKKDMRIRKVGAALEILAVATEQVKVLYALMSETQQKLFMALASGQDELHACLSAGIHQGIVKIVYHKNGRPIYAQQLTAKSVDNLDELSYQRLLRVARATVRRYLKDYGYNDYQVSISEMFQLLAPQALGTILDIAQNGRDSLRLKAAQDILNRAGYETRPKEHLNEEPPRVIIHYDAQPSGAKALG